MSLTLSPRYSVSSAATEPLRYPLMASTSATLLAFGTASPRFDPDPHRHRCSGATKNGRSSDRPCTLPRDVLRPARVAPLSEPPHPVRPAPLRFRTHGGSSPAPASEGRFGNHSKGSRSGRSDLRAIGNRTVFGLVSVATAPISRQTNCASGAGRPPAAARVRERAPGGPAPVAHGKPAAGGAVDNREQPT